MKKVPVIIAAAILLLCVSSCDFFRSLAGRPVTAQIEQKRILIQKSEARRDSLERVRLDSIAFAERYAADSLYALDTLGHKGKLRNASGLSNISRSALDRRYYIVAGAFSNEKNAARLSGRYSDAGFESFVFRYRSGLNAVFVAPSDSIVEILSAYRSIVKLPFASSQTWVLVNE